MWPDSTVNSFVDCSTCSNQVLERLIVNNERDAVAAVEHESVWDRADSVRMVNANWRIDYRID